MIYTSAILAMMLAQCAVSMKSPACTHSGASHKTHSVTRHVHPVPGDDFATAREKVKVAPWRTPNGKSMKFQFNHPGNGKTWIKCPVYIARNKWLDDHDEKNESSIRELETTNTGWDSSLPGIYHTFTLPADEGADDLRIREIVAWLKPVSEEYWELDDVSHQAYKEPGSQLGIGSNKHVPRKEERDEHKATAIKPNPAILDRLSNGQSIPEEQKIVFDQVWQSSQYDKEINDGMLHKKFMREFTLYPDEKDTEKVFVCVPDNKATKVGNFATWTRHGETQMMGDEGDQIAYKMDNDKDEVKITIIDPRWPNNKRETVTRKQLLQGGINTYHDTRVWNEIPNSRFRVTRWYEKDTEGKIHICVKKEYMEKDGQGNWSPKKTQFFPVEYKMHSVYHTLTPKEKELEDYRRKVVADMAEAARKRAAEAALLRETIEHLDDEGKARLYELELESGTGSDGFWKKVCRWLKKLLCCCSKSAQSGDASQDS